jgi:signal transduction histidine kinase
MTVEPKALLKQLFPVMDDAALAEITRLARMRTYPADTILCHEGVEEDIFYILGAGQAVITQQLETEERFLRYVEPGQYFGEMGLIANTPRNATVKTVVESTVLEIDKATFIEMLRQNPVIALTMFHTTVGWLRSNDRAAIAALTESKHQIEEAYEALQQQEERRSEFLTTLAHELRTPLTTANGFMQLIKSGSMNGPALQMGLDKVASGLDQVVSLVNDLMFVQEMDLIAPTIRPVNLRGILQLIVDESEDHALDNDVTIVVEIPEELPELKADSDGLTRAMGAILHNAIKFSPNGGEVRIEVVHSADHINISFIDPGIGIAPEFMPRIFERFERQEKYGEMLFGGIGLGLPIAKHLIESMGGTISVISEVDKGSMFTVHLPVLITDSKASGQVQQTNVG